MIEKLLAFNCTQFTNLFAHIVLFSLTEAVLSYYTCHKDTFSKYSESTNEFTYLPVSLFIWAKKQIQKTIALTQTLFEAIQLVPARIVKIVVFLSTGFFEAVKWSATLIFGPIKDTVLWAISLPGRIFKWTVGCLKNNIFEPTRDLFEWIIESIKYIFVWIIEWIKLFSSKWIAVIFWPLKVCRSIFFIHMLGLATADQIRELDEKLDFLLKHKDKPPLQYNSKKILDKVLSHDHCKLENKYCIISFNAQSQKKHQDYIKPCVTGRERTKLFGSSTYMVQNPKDVLKIPRNKAMLVFVDKNETDTILEMPGSTEIDLRLLTVQACLKMNAEVFVIYTGDEGSDNLTPGLYCNPQITTITEHPLLKELEADNRVITCYKTLTFSQQGKIAEFIA